MFESVADLVFRVIVVLTIMAGWLWIVGGWLIRRRRQRREVEASGKDPGASSAAS